MTSFRTRAGALCLSALMIALVGCGSSAPRRYAVSGDVKWRKQPLDHGAIMFLADPPDSLATSAGAQITNGRYSIPADKGLLPGKYKVSITSADPSKAPDPDALPGPSGPLPKDRINPKYNVETILTAEVTAAGTNTFNFGVD